MLSIGRLGGSGGSPRDVGYYTASVAQGRDDYYAGAGEAPGTWAGSGAALLGLDSGEVDAADLAALMAGRDPRSERQLRRAVRPDAVVGFDLTFSAPKSASILYGAGGPQVAAAVRRAHDEATTAALGYMEREACRARRGRDGVEQVVGDGFVAGAFRHRSSRAGDPQLHTHVVVGNLTRGPDGRWTALDGRALYQHAKTGGFVYQAELRARLTDRLGVEWGPVVNGMADVEGMPRGLIEHFSKRRAEIVEALADRHSSSARSAQAAALETRRAKDYSVDSASLYDRWRKRAIEHGLGDDELAALLGKVVERPAIDGPALDELDADLAGPLGLTRRASTFDRRAVVQAYAAAHVAGASVERVEGVADRLLASAHVVAVEHGSRERSAVLRRADGRLVAGPAGPRYSTPEMLARELALVATSTARKGEGAGAATAVATEAALAARPGLSVEQAAMVRSLTSSGDGVQLVRAAAGVGKTYALEVARDAWTASGYTVVGAALSARAACELRDLGGIDATTVARLRIDLDRGFGLGERTVLVIDEAGMVGTRDLEHVAGAARSAGAKLVLVGDDRQLPEIDAGGAFRGLADRLGACELQEVRRQRDRADRAALTAYRDGRPAEWIRSMDARDRLVVVRGVDEQYERIVSDWWQGQQQLEADGGGDEALMLAPTREAVRELNVRAQAHRRQAGRLGDRELAVDGGPGIARGDRIVCLENRERDLGVLNGQRGTVAEVDVDTRSLRVQIDGGQEVVLPPSYVEHGKVALGYATTVHKSQGMTVAQSYVLGTEELYDELGYTAFSRHRDDCRFYVNAGELVADPELAVVADGGERDEVLEQVARQLGRSRAQELALDVCEQDERLATVADAELLDRSQDSLGQLLASFPDEARTADLQAAELERQAERIRVDEQRLIESQAERERLGRFAAAARRELDERVERQQAALASARDAYGRLTDSHRTAQAAGDRWLEDNDATLAQLTAIERELAQRRRRAYSDAVVRAAHDPDPELERTIGPRPESLLERERWDRAAATVEGYRIRYGEPLERQRPGAADAARRDAWDRARADLDDLAPPEHPDRLRQVGLDAADVELPEFDPGP